MKRLSLASVACLASVSAFAADLPNSKGAPAFAPPPPPTFSWTGFYIGANAGAIWDGSRNTLVDFSSDGYDVGPAFRSKDSLGWLAGVHAGYNWQASQFVFGVEGDFDGTGLRHNNNGNLTVGGAPFGTSLYGVSDRLNWLASARGRLGYALGAWMPYVTGGAAWSDTHYTGFVTNNLASGGGYGPYDQTQVRTGWVVGAGLEYMVAPNWLFRAEYLHYGFGGEQIIGATNPTFYPGARGVFTLGSTSFNVVRAGVSYKFDLFAPPAPVVAKY